MQCKKGHDSDWPSTTTERPSHHLSGHHRKSWRKRCDECLDDPEHCSDILYMRCMISPNEKHCVIHALFSNFVLLFVVTLGAMSSLNTFVSTRMSDSMVGDLAHLLEVARMVVFGAGLVFTIVAVVSRDKHPRQPTRFCEPAQSKCTSRMQQTSRTRPRDTSD